MNKIYNICKSLAAVAITTAMVCSCDSTANDIKIEAVNGHYNGTVIVGLYVPDLVIEAENTFITDGETIGICADTVNTTIGMEFYNNNQVKISVDKLNNIEFNIPFLDAEGNVRDIYSDGYLAYLYNMTRQLLDRGVITQEEFSQFYEQIDTLHDRMTVSGITTNLMPMVEQGAMLASYDYEQNSYYTQFNLSEFTYQRTAEVLKPFENCRVYEKTLSTLIQTNETYESTQIDAFFESKPKIDAFLKIDANAQRQEYKMAS